MKNTPRAPPKKQAWSEPHRDKKPRWRDASEEETTYQEIHFQRLDRPNTSSLSAPCFGTARASGLFRPIGKLTNYTPDSITRSGNVMVETSLKTKARGGNVRTLSHRSILPPIYGSRIIAFMPDASVHGPGHPVGSQQHKIGKKTNLSAAGARKDNALLRKQKEAGQLTTAHLICSSLAVFSVRERVRDADTRATIKCENRIFDERIVMHNSTVLEQLGRRLSPEESNPSANDSGVMTGAIRLSASRCDTKQQTEPYSDSAIETESRCSQGKENEDGSEGTTFSQEEEYYTNQRIAEWIMNVNASLFSPSNNDMSIQTLEEQDVDTIKIIYDRD